jgi:peptide/nickel transport system permease protein
MDRGSVSDAFVGMLFGTPSADGKSAAVLDGTYTLQLEVLTADSRDRAGTVQLVMGGSIFGVLGTDALGRDLAQGLLYGLPIALLIGISTAVISTFIGMGLGLASGYFGGATDMIIQRAADIVANVPLLPLLIFLVFIGGSKLWLILLVLVAFSWPGLTIMVRTMVLQLRTGQEVEAAQALGSSGTRVVVRHILPHAASFVLAQLVFSAPSAILAEAGLSFLGLGDPSLPTWGQILEYGFRTGAVYLGYWWWVIPPGLAIVITAVTFMFLALGLEPVVDPRLRGRRLWRS